MTDEMAIQGQRPSAMPYVLGGALAGGGIGAIAGNCGVGASQAFKSWEDAVADVNKDDSFVKSQADKLKDDAEKVKPWNTIKDQAEAKKKADDALKAVTMPDGFDGQTELNTYMQKQSAVEKAEKAVADKYQAEFEKELKVVQEMKIEEGKPYQFKGVDYDEKKLKDLLASEKPEDKQLVKELVEDRKGYKDAVAGDFAKTEKEAVTTAKNELNTAKEALTKKNKGAEVLKEEFMNKYKPLKNAADEAKAKAEKEIGNILKDCKKPNILIPAAIGAVVLGLGGLLLRPSAEEV